jgi:acetyl-CoA carboxylase, biotin carboxylase subunit
VNPPRRFHRILVANRGEIAARVIRTCRRLGIESVLTVSDADAGSMPARLADKAIRIGPPPAAESYLDVEAVTAAALAAGADAVHPGYGFLSENARLARACAAAGVVFVGPAEQTLAATGDKLAAREHAVAAGLPVLPGVRVTPDTLRVVAGGVVGGHGATGHAKVDAPVLFPVLVKAAGGGGGRGLRVVLDEAGLARAVAVASSEAAAAFGDPRIYVEPYVPRVRHVEVQILGDGERMVHLGDRDCSVQRRYQKVIEEAPAPGLTKSLRKGLHEAAVTLGKYLGYRGAGTVEFLVDPARETFYFLEVNARIQVEHPVTEAITGLDLVEEQIAIAEGRPLRVRQDDVTFTGHAIECRINAEDPSRDFLPSPGTITRAMFPAGPDVRVDTHVQAGATVPAYYDSLLAKIISRGANRGEALETLRGAVGRCAIDGVVTNLDLHRGLLADSGFRKSGVDTGYLERWLAREQALLARGDDPPEPPVSADPRAGDV